MGYYVNPSDMTKEEWIIKNAKKVSKEDAFQEVSNEENAVLILIDNGLFTACGVAYSEDEFRAFTYITDTRPKSFFTVDRKLLKEVVEDFEYIDWEV